MRDSEFKVAKLNTNQFSELKGLEEKIGVSLIAFEKKYDLAHLSEGNLKLIKEFERNGNSAVNVKSSDNTASFSSLEWLDFSHETKQEILLSYRLAYLSESMVNWCPELGTVLALSLIHI